jgi:hypothetical protein
MLMLLICSTATAQVADFGADFGAGQAIKLDPTLKANVARAIRSEYRGILIAALRVEIGHMRQQLGLSDKAVKQLELAAKGAAKRYCDKRVPGIVAGVSDQLTSSDISVNGIRVTPDTGSQVQPTIEKPQKRGSSACRIIVQVTASQVMVSVQSSNGGSASGSRGGLHQVQQDERWQRSINSVTTKEERQAYEKYQADLQRNYATDLITSHLAIGLRFTPADRAKLHKWVHKQTRSVTDIPPHVTKYWVLSVLPKQFRIEELDAIFSADQVRLIRMGLLSLQQTNPF